MSTVRPTAVISADKHDQDDNSGVRTVCQIGRSGITNSNFSVDLLTLKDMEVYEFPYSASDGIWCTNVSEVLNSLSLHDPVFLIEPSGSSLIPETLYRRDDLYKLFETLGVNTAMNAISEYISPKSDNRLVSLFPKDLYEIFESGRIISDLCPILESGSSSKNGHLQVVVRDEQLDLILLNKTVLLLNRFNADNENDILYFCVAAIEQAGLNIEDVAVTISGNPKKLDSLAELFSKYFIRLQKHSTPKKVNVPYAFKEVDPAMCWSTLNAHLCV